MTDRNTSKTCWSILILLALAGTGAIASDGGDRAGSTTVQYDLGTPTGTRTANVGYYWLGNVFNTSNGSPLSTAQLRSISWYQGAAGAGGGKILLNGPSQNSNFYPAAGSSNTFQLFMVPGAGIEITPPIFVGIGAPYVIPVQQGGGANIGFSSTGGSQGFHASQRNLAGTLQAPITNQNMIVRISYDAIIPVELLEFELED